MKIFGKYVIISRTTKNDIPLLLFMPSMSLLVEIKRISWEKGVNFLKEKLIELVEKDYLKKDLPQFKAGDTIAVYYRVKEGNKERIQMFEGVVIRISGGSVAKNFTVRKVSSGVGVERIIPINSPLIEKIEVKRIGKVRRARLYYLRNLSGKAARIKEIRK